MDEKWDAELTSIIRRNELMKQAFDNIENEKAAINKIQEYFQKGGMSLVEAIFLTLMSSLKGGAGSGGFNLGF